MRYLVLLLLITSCASRKVDVSKTEIKTNTDSISITKIDGTAITNTNINLVENSEELEICPLVDSLPIVVNGVTYNNVVLRYKKHNKVLVDTSTKKESENVLKQVSKSKQETKNIKEKHIDKKANYFIYLWLLLIPAGMYLWRKFKQSLLL